MTDGFVSWPGEIDLAPDAMYEGIKARGEWGSRHLPPRLSGQAARDRRQSRPGKTVKLSLKGKTGEFVLHEILALAV